MRHRIHRRGNPLRLLAGMAAVAGIAACSQVDSTPRQTRSEQRESGMGSVFGDGGMFNLNTSKNSTNNGGGVLGVNSFLWRASLDTLSFMPLASADPFGGVIITDWYTPPATPTERFKVTVYILDRALRADGIRVAVFRQVRQGGGETWTDQAVAPETQVNMENSILTRARELRVASAGL